MCKEYSVIRENEIASIKNSLQIKESEIENASQTIRAKEQEIIEGIEERKELEEKLQAAIQKADFQENLMFLAKSECFRYNSRTIYKIFRMVYRFREQFMRGNYEDRRNFRKLLMANITHKRITGTRTDGFNPMYNIINILDGVEYGGKSSIQVAEDSKESGLVPQKVKTDSLSKTTKAVLKEKYEKADIIIFSVIDYDFRYQRPQHFAARFAANGHRVFYVNANFNRNSQVKEISDGLFVVDFSTKKFNAIYETDFSQDKKWLTDNLDKLTLEYAIRDAVVIVDYPNWINGADYLKQKYGFTMVTDYMDDFTGFLGTTTNILKDNCIKLLEHSDLVVPSSQFLMTSL